MTLVEIRCRRRRHLFARALLQGGTWWLEVPRYGAHAANSWFGAPLRRPLVDGSGVRTGCACGRWALLNDADVIDAISRGDTLVIID